MLKVNLLLRRRTIKPEVYCTLTIEGTHCWSACPFDEVAYLRDPHRHVFHIKAYSIVSHSDRDVEFIMLKHKIHNHIVNKYGINPCMSYAKSGQEIRWDGHFCEFGAMSCEMLAEELVIQFDLSRCEVSEDNENGAIVTA